MKIYAPKYYNYFKCSAQNCKNSCCINWEIDIDSNTLHKYESLSHPYSDTISKSIDYSDSPHFVLTSNNRCPHLNSKGLCDIIINCGEEYICDICREHPRFYNYTNRGKEIGLGMCCEEACKLIINSDCFDQMIEIGSNNEPLTKSEFNAIDKRKTVFKMLKDNTVQIDGKVEMMYDYFDVFLYRYNFAKIMPTLEYLVEDHKELLLKAKRLVWNRSFSDELSRILAYYVYRHCSEASDYDEFFVSLSFAIFCTGLISALSKEYDLYEIARIVSEEIEYSQENTDKIKALFSK